MKTVEEVRRIRLINEASKAGSQKALADLLDCSASQLGQYMGGHREIGKIFARNVERKLNKPTAWMDQPLEAEIKNNIAAEEKQNNYSISTEKALSAIEEKLEKLEPTKRQEAASLMAIYMTSLRPTTKQDLIALLDEGNQSARKVA